MRAIQIYRRVLEITPAHSAATLELARLEKLVGSDLGKVRLMKKLVGAIHPVIVGEYTFRWRSAINERTISYLWARTSADRWQKL